MTTTDAPVETFAFTATDPVCMEDISPQPYIVVSGDKTQIADRLAELSMRGYAPKLMCPVAGDYAGRMHVLCEHAYVRPDTRGVRPEDAF